MGFSRPWKPASQHDAIEAVVRSEVLPEVFERLKRKKQARAAAAREAEAKTYALRRLRELFNLPKDTIEVPNHWQG
ncbi:hypothetical protein ABWH92_05480 [Ahrensia marina]|jgi:predicted nucleic acid-binding protein|uniref:hypothetical protein n=1 Tax=Ahrensia marina TaxID=1514904 RepID=UPI0035CFFBDE